MQGTGFTQRTGFTLVELLVSLGLVLLIMSLFAQAFGIAASSIKKQRGLAENDQRARSMVTILLGDLQKRTFRQRDDAITQPINVPVDAAPGDIAIARLLDRANRQSLGIVPLHPDYFLGGAQNDPTDPPSTWTATGGNGAAVRDVRPLRERGYFYISEGDPSDDADDVLKFTIDVSTTQLGNGDTTRLIGRAVVLNPTWDQGGTPSPFDDSPTNRDQPIWDDGKGWQDVPGGGRRSYVPGEAGTTASKMAELAYFIRNGRLYRRLTLIREPLEHVVGADTGEGQPNDADDGSGGLTLAPGYAGDFWNDFDNAASRADFNASPSPLFFMAEPASLDNTVAGVRTMGGTGYPDPPNRYWSLGDPRNRFGHDNAPVDGQGMPLVLQGRPKHYMNPGNPSTFIGLYTHEETSHPRFDYPGLPTYQGGSTSPFAYGVDINGDSQLDLSDLDVFMDGPREGEDILLPNCHAFDVKVWDDQVGEFVDLLHTLPTVGGSLGDYHISRLTDTSPSNRMDEPNNLPGRFQGAQWNMIRYGSLTGALGGLENRIFDTWHPAFNFTNDTKDNPITGATEVFPDNDPPPSRPLWSDRENFLAGTPMAQTPITAIEFWQPGDTTLAPTDAVFPRPNLPDGTNAAPPHMSFFYIIDQAKDLDSDSMISTGPSQPNWPEAPGAMIPDNEIRWKAIPNTIGLKAIQISVRFFDPTSGQMRQLTLTHSFVEL